MARNVLIAATVITMIIALSRTHGAFTLRAVPDIEENKTRDKLMLASTIADGALVLMSMIMLTVVNLTHSPAVRICSIVPWFLLLLGAAGIDVAFSISKILHLDDHGVFDDSRHYHLEMLICSWATGICAYVLMFIFAVIAMIQEARRARLSSSKSTGYQHNQQNHQQHQQNHHYPQHHQYQDQDFHKY